MRARSTHRENRWLREPRQAKLAMQRKKRKKDGGSGGEGRERDSGGDDAYGSTPQGELSRVHLSLTGNRAN